MAEKKYDKTGRLLFTKEMKKEYTILMPQMLPIHFSMFVKCFELEGFKIEMLQTTHSSIVENGLKYVHNDTCYPALLVIGQLIDALKSGKYDMDKTAVVITQTGGGCRASNYIHLLRKALKKAGLEHIPVVSLNMSGLEKNPGFSLSLKLLLRMVFSILYGDLIMLLSNQCRPYEMNAGETDRKIEEWVERLVKGFTKRGSLNAKRVKENLDLIVKDFASIPRHNKKLVRVGVVGEIYVKFAPLGNNNLEEFLLHEGCEVVVPGLLDFVIFKIDNRLEDVGLYGGPWLKRVGFKLFENYIIKNQYKIINAVKTCDDFRAPEAFPHIKELVKGYLGYGNKMGEGWLLTGEMLELIGSGVGNIVCTQPFGCLPNHIAGKGMIRKIRENNPTSNIVTIDYDPGATRINQENRIKLMLAGARARMEEQEGREGVKERETAMV